MPVDSGHTPPAWGLRQGSYFSSPSQSLLPHLPGKSPPLLHRSQPYTLCSEDRPQHQCGQSREGASREREHRLGQAAPPTLTRGQPHPGFGRTSRGLDIHISPGQSAAEQLNAPSWQTLGRQKHAFRCLPCPPPHPHSQQCCPPPPPCPSHPLQPPALPSPACAVPDELSSWGQFPGLLLQGQGQAPGQRDLGAGARRRGHTCAVVQQLRQGSTGSVTLAPPLLRAPHTLPPTRSQGPERTCSPGQPQPGRQGSCIQRALGCRCEQRRGHEVAQALSTWPGGHSGGQCTDGELGYQGGNGPTTCPAKCQLSSAAPEGREAPPTPTPRAHQGRAADYIPAAALCPGPGMAPPQDPPHSSDVAPWSLHHREQSSCSRWTKVQRLGTHGVGTPGIRWYRCCRQGSRAQVKVNKAFACR